MILYDATSPPPLPPLLPLLLSWRRSEKERKGRSKNFGETGKYDELGSKRGGGGAAAREEREEGRLGGGRGGGGAAREEREVEGG